MDIGGVIPFIRHGFRHRHAPLGNLQAVAPISKIGESHNGLSGHPLHFLQNDFGVFHRLYGL